MRVKTKAYGTIDLGPLETALFEAVSDHIQYNDDRYVPVSRIAATLTGLHAVPSDYFWAAWDNEVSALADLYDEVRKQ